VAISYVTGVVIYRSCQTMPESVQSNEVQLAVWDWSIFRTLPIITFALTCHLQAVPIYQVGRVNNGYLFQRN
jgi:hypothetical protein